MLKWCVFQETIYWKLCHYYKHVLLEEEIDANIRLKCICDCLSEVSHLMKQKGLTVNDIKTTSYTTIIKKKCSDEDLNAAKVGSKWLCLSDTSALP